MSKPKLDIESGIVALTMGIACLIGAIFEVVWLIRK
jgi:hypothetical protein